MTINKSDYYKWLYPGLGIKRWIFVGIVGLGAIILGIWNIINNQYTRDMAVAFVNWLEIVLPDLGFYPGIICFACGIFFIVLGVRCFIAQFLSGAMPNQQRSYYDWKTLQQGPKIVVIGGGTGLSVLLRGLKNYSSNITAIVSVGDDGGSSGRLREEYGVVPVGDIRNCIVALSDQEAVMEQLFNYRFHQGKELEGHSLGNLLLVAMSNLKGNFQDAVADIDQVLHIRGKVLPVAVEPLTLKATLADNTEIVGESNISQAWLPIKQLQICPAQAEPLKDVLSAIDEADVIILGPGSLYTSIIPNLLVNGVVEHIIGSKGLVYYICNVMTQAGETDGYTAEDHLASLFEHSSPEMLDYIVVNDQEAISVDVLSKYLEEGAVPVTYDRTLLETMGVEVITARLINDQEVLRHDGQRLARIIVESLYQNKEFLKSRGTMQNMRDRAQWQLKQH